MSITLFNAYKDTPERIQELAHVVDSVKSYLKKKSPGRSFGCISLLRPEPSKAFIYAPPRIHSFLYEATRAYDSHQPTTERDIEHAFDVCTTQEEYRLLEFVMGRPLASIERDVLPRRAELSSMERTTNAPDTPAPRQG